MNYCKDCKHWIPNGGVLGYGYCRANMMGYRKPTQSCEKNFINNTYTNERLSEKNDR